MPGSLKEKFHVLSVFMDKPVFMTITGNKFYKRYISGACNINNNNWNAN